VLPLLLLSLLLSDRAARAQGTAFTYQGRLTDGGAPANANYDLQFTLWDASVGGTQQPQPAPATLTKTSVPVTGGVFSVLLDFGVSAFPGADRFLEVGVRPAGIAAAFTLLSPRQQISSTPYALRTLNATAADSLSSACVGCVQDAQINSVSATKVTGTLPAASLPPDSASYVQNRTTPQTNSNFNISGNGVIGGDLTVTGKINASISGNFIQNGTVLQNNANFNISGNGIVGGNVGIGAATPASKLDVRGHLLLDPNASPILYTSSTAGEQNRFLQLINSPSTPSASGLKAGGILVADSYSFANPGKNDLIVKGNAGIGTTFPASRLHVAGSSSFITPFLGLTIDERRLAGSTGAGGYSLKITTTSPGTITSPGVTGTNFLIDSSGNVGVGTDAPTSKVEIAAQDGLKITGFQPFLTLDDSSANGRSAFVQGVNGNLVLLSNSRQSMVLKDNGHVSLNVLEIQGGADLAEDFEVDSAKTVASIKTEDRIKPGLLVSIDPSRTGRLVVSRRAYDRRVAGIISGAGGINAGMVMGQSGAPLESKRPVALSGRVYCWADAGNGPIHPGDLLTSSARTGYAMKVRNYRRARGAIVGKAMTDLKSGSGLVLVLVGLQ
jgi:hypothetical protein